LTAPSLRCCSGQSPSSAAQPSVRAAFARHQHRPPRRHDDGPGEHSRPWLQRDAGYQPLRPDSDRARHQRPGKPGRSPGTRVDPTALRGQRPGGVQALKRSRSTFLSNLPALVFGTASMKTTSSGSHHLAVAAASGGFWGVPRPSVADYVMRTGHEAGGDRRRRGLEVAML